MIQLFCKMCEARIREHIIICHNYLNGTTEGAKKYVYGQMKASQVLKLCQMKDKTNTREWKWAGHHLKYTRILTDKTSKEVCSIRSIWDLPFGGGVGIASKNQSKTRKIREWRWSHFSYDISHHWVWYPWPWWSRTAINNNYATTALSLCTHR